MCDPVTRRCGLWAGRTRLRSVTQRSLWVDIVSIWLTAEELNVDWLAHPN